MTTDSLSADPLTTQSLSTESLTAAPPAGEPLATASVRAGALTEEFPPGNAVRLAGRLAAEPELRELPSGTRMVQFRLVVRRECGRGRPAEGRAPGSDTIDCVRWDEPVDSAYLSWVPGSFVEVEGCLRRRFWRSGGGNLASRYEVDVHEAIITG